MFKKVMISLVAVTALSAAAMPAAAQNRGGYDRGGHDRDRYEQNWDRIDNRFQRVDRRIDQGLRNGQLSRREAQRLRGQFYELIRLERNYSRDGLSRWERNDLDRRFDHLSAQVRYERRDRDDRRW